MGSGPRDLRRFRAGIRHASDESQATPGVGPAAAWYSVGGRWAVRTTPESHEARGLARTLPAGGEEIEASWRGLMLQNGASLCLQTPHPGLSCQRCWLGKP